MGSNKIQNLRNRKGWTQAHLASLCGITQAMIARFEGGEVPSRKTLASLARVFDVSEKDLVSVSELVNVSDLNSAVKDLKGFSDDDKIYVIRLIGMMRERNSLKQKYRQFEKLID